MNKQRDINSSLKSFERQIYWSVLSIFLLVAISTASIYMLGRRDRLRSYAKMIRHNFIVHDIHQSMLSLQPSVSDDEFKSVEAFDSDRHVLFAIPNSSVAGEVNPTLSSVEVHITDTGVDDEGSINGVLRARFSVLYFVLSSVLFAMVMMLGAYILVSRGRKSILQEHARSLEIEKAMISSKMAAQVAHDMRSPLTALKMLSKIEASTEESRELMRKASSRLEKIADDLLGQIRNDGTKATFVKLLNLTDELKSLVEEKQVVAPKGMRIEYRQLDYDSRCAVICEPAMLMRMLSNLIQNSIEANAGVIEVGTANIESKVEFSIRDDGTGMSSRTLQTALKQGYTTKTFGNGIGLKSSYDLVLSWGGEFIVESTQGKGTVVRLLLPSSI